MNGHQAAKMRDVLAPFAAPRASTRKAQRGAGDWPEQDRMTIEVSAGDWLRLCVLAGTLTSDQVAALPIRVRPGIMLLQELEQLEDVMGINR